jgi:quinohemoprotein ethanol dehydrogenase
VPGINKGGNIRNLGYVGRDTIENLDTVLFDGPFKDKGMPDFTGKLTAAEVRQIKAFIAGTADAIRPKAAPAATPPTK